MAEKLVHLHFNQNSLPISPKCVLDSNLFTSKVALLKLKKHTSSNFKISAVSFSNQRHRSSSSSSISASLDLTEDNIKKVLVDARTELAQLFDTSVNITGKAELVELDGPYVKISLKGRFWHERSLVLARLGNYLKQKIPEILEVEIEDEKQLDDSPENF